MLKSARSESGNNIPITARTISGNREIFECAIGMKLLYKNRCTLTNKVSKDFDDEMYMAVILNLNPEFAIIYI